jgi:hypothetical protein
MDVSSELEGQPQVPPLEPWQMLFEDYSREYEAVMQQVASKEKIGGLDPADKATYRAMTPEEHALMERNWEDFSRTRGFSEADITEYNRWMKLSGQTDFPEDSYNDHWRRPRLNTSENLYLRFIQKAQEEGSVIDPAILESAQSVRTALEAQKLNRRELTTPSLPEQAELAGGVEDGW